jgi:putative phosphoribosyl transferase
MIFSDRNDAALRLIPMLEKYKDERGVVLAVPRGGVPLGYIIARNFNFPLELILTKKIGHPASPEYAIGAVGLEGEEIENRQDVPEEYLRNEIARIRQSLHARNKKFMGERKPVDLENKIVIIVDDGIATGHTILAAIRMIKKKHPKKIVVAVPVAPYSAIRKFKQIADDFICLHTPEDFLSVGQFYEDFSEVSDEEVIELLHAAYRRQKVA